MRSIYFALIGASLVAACGQKKTTVAQDSTSRDIQLTTPDSTVALNDAPAVKPEATKTDTVYLPQPTPPAPPPPAPRVTPPKRNPPVSHPAPSPSNPPSPPPAPPVASTLPTGTILETRSTVALSSTPPAPRRPALLRSNCTRAHPPRISPSWTMPATR